MLQRKGEATNKKNVSLTTPARKQRGAQGNPTQRNPNTTNKNTQPRMQQTMGVSNKKGTHFWPSEISRRQYY
jgi:hypothetical protein